MLQRILFQLLQSSLQRQPAVILLGPRQVGKTTLAHEIKKDQPARYLDLESPEDLSKLSDPLLYLRAHDNYLVILDEIQRTPGLFPILRGIIDERRAKGKGRGQFLLLGSASLDLMRQSSESLAGRMTPLELTPLTLLEVQENSWQDLWIRGGFPISFLEIHDQASFKWRQDFIRTYLERDIPQLGPRIPAETMRRFWTMLAHVQGCLLNASMIATNLGLSAQSITRYIDLLVDLLLVRRLHPYHANIRKRLVKSPKVYIRDTGLLHSLLGLQTLEQVLSHPIMGQSFESFVIENCLNNMPAFTNAYFYRTAVGAEIDLVLEFPDQSLWAVEIKSGIEPKIQKGFFYALEDLKPTKSFVIYSGQERYPLREGVEAISLRSFLQELRAIT